MQQYTNPFNAISQAQNELISRGLNLLDNTWASEVLGFSCDKWYERGVHYKVTLHVNEKGFAKIKGMTNLQNEKLLVSSVSEDKMVRIEIILNDLVRIITIVPEERLDETVAF